MKDLRENSLGTHLKYFPTDSEFINIISRVSFYSSFNIQNRHLHQINSNFQSNKLTLVKNLSKFKQLSIF